MADDPKQYQEEEYLFSEDSSDAGINPSIDDSFVASEDEQAPSPAPQAPMLSKITQWRKNIFIGCGFLVVVILVYKIIGGIMEPKVSGSITSIPEQPVASVVQNQSNVNAAQTAQQQSLAQGLNQNTAAAPSLHDVVNSYNQNHGGENRIAKLEVISSSMRQQVNNLSNVTQGLQSSIDQINTQLTQLNATLAILTDKMQTQVAQQQAAQKKVAVKSSTLMAKPAIKKTVYHIMAIIPGRAWLKSSNASTVTVSVGTQLPGYGTVSKIDPQLGNVVTSSGQIIQYSADDQ